MTLNIKNKIKKLPQSVLFVCDLNAIRSPIAEAFLKNWFKKQIFVDSCGIRKGSIDPMVVEIMAEKKYDLSNHKSKTLNQLDDSYYDLMIAFSENAYNSSIEYTKTSYCQVEYLPIPDPSLAIGNREQKLESYRSVRNDIFSKLKTLFRYYQ